MHQNAPFSTQNSKNFPFLPHWGGDTPSHTQLRRCLRPRSAPQLLHLRRLTAPLASSSLVAKDRPVESEEGHAKFSRSKVGGSDISTPLIPNTPTCRTTPHPIRTGRYVNAVSCDYVSHSSLLQSNIFIVSVCSFGQLILRKIIEIGATICQILTLKCTKNSILAGAPPQTPPGSLQHSPDLLVGFQWSYL